MFIIVSLLHLNICFVFELLILFLLSAFSPMSGKEKNSQSNKCVDCNTDTQIVRKHKAI